MNWIKIEDCWINLEKVQYIASEMNNYPNLIYVKFDDKYVTIPKKSEQQLKAIDEVMKAVNDNGQD